MRKIVFCLLSFFYFFTKVQGQGCNDAGFCTIGDLKPAQQSDSTNSAIAVSTIFRLGEKETMLLTLQAQGELKLWKGSKFSVQIPFHFIYGNLGFIAGAGDIAPSFTQEIYRNGSTKLSLTFGGKTPVNNSNLRQNGNSLPMAYQLSQGTWDGIAGISLFHKVWHFSLGFQHNFNANENEYIDSLSLLEKDVTFFDSKKIDRGDDVLFRIERIFEKEGRQKYFLSILPIYRIQEAIIETPSGDRISVKGSSGLTLNINAGYFHPLGKKGKMKFLLGFPTITRHVRPDGLTGSFVVSLSANWAL